MRHWRRGLAVALPLVLVAIGAVAQPKGKGKDKGKVEEAPSASASAAPVPTATAAAPPTADPALGAAPPPASASAGPKPSPLTPRADEFPDGGAAPAPAKYDALLGEIATLRGRVAALTQTLFSSQIIVKVQVEDDAARIESFEVTLDDGVVYSAPQRFAAEDEKTVYEHAVAPGHHVLGVAVTRYDSRAREWRSAQTTQLSVVVPENAKLETVVRLEDDSDMAVDFPDDKDGEYDLRVRLRARVVEK